MESMLFLFFFLDSLSFSSGSCSRSHSLQLDQGLKESKIVFAYHAINLPCLSLFNYLPYQWSDLFLAPTYRRNKLTISLGSSPNPVYFPTGVKRRKPGGEREREIGRKMESWERKRKERGFYFHGLLADVFFFSPSSFTREEQLVQLPTRPLPEQTPVVFELDSFGIRQWRERKEDANSWQHIKVPHEGLA